MWSKGVAGREARRGARVSGFGRLCWVVLQLALGVYASPAAAAAPRLLVEVVDFGPPVISPSGTHVAYRVEQASVERNTHDTVWYVQPIVGGAPPVRVADGGPPLHDSAGIVVPVRAVWSPDSAWIYYLANLDGRIDVWRAAADGMGTERLTDDPADVRAFALDAEGAVLKFSVGATREQVTQAEAREYDRGIHIDETAPLGQNLHRSGLGAGRLATQRLGFWFDRVPLLADVADRWQALDLTTRQARVLGMADMPAKVLAPADVQGIDPLPWKVALEPASGRIALLSRVGERGGLRDPPRVELAVAAGKDARTATRCTASACTDRPITEIQWRPGGDEVLFTVTDQQQGYAQSIYRWHVESQRVEPVVHGRGLVGGGRNRFSTCGLSAQALACVTADANQPPQLERIDIESGRREVLFRPNAALARMATETQPVELLRWQDDEGRQFSGHYFPARHAGAEPPPLFVNYYRCLGYLRGGMGDEWPLAALAEQGIAALCINAVPYPRDAVERYEAARSAVESAVALLAARGEVDGRRVGMGGLSFGSEATFWTLMHGDVLTAASVSSPAISEQYFLLGSIKGEAFLPLLQRSWQLGDPRDTPERWRLVSPTANLDRITAPVLMQMAEQELTHALGYAVPLILAGKADVYAFPHAPHQKYQPRQKLAVYERNLDWFRFWLLGAEDPAHDKLAQYRHWRAMRVRLQARDADGD